MKAKPLQMRGDEYVTCNPSEAKFVEIHVPGKNVRRIIPVILREPDEEEVGPVWIWNGDTQRPTLTPNVFTQNPKTGICHFKLTDGKVEFLMDSTHEHVGETMDLLEID